MGAVACELKQSNNCFIIVFFSLCGTRSCCRATLGIEAVVTFRRLVFVPNTSSLKNKANWGGGPQSRSHCGGTHWVWIGDNGVSQISCKKTYSPSVIPMNALSLGTLLSLPLVCKGRQMWRDRACILIGWYLKIHSTLTHTHIQSERWMFLARLWQSYPE